MTGFVYAIAADNGLVKIGHSAQPKKRLAKISSDASSPCRLIGYVPATREQEAALHQVLLPSRVNREWYRRDTAVQMFLDLLPKREFAAKERRPKIVVFSGSPPHSLTTTAEVTEVLGGFRKLAEITGCKPKAAWNWKSFNTFPSNTFVTMRDALKAAGYTAPPSLWSMIELPTARVAA